MDKNYLIHNIKINDDPADQHNTIDIALDNIIVGDSDITADVAITMKTNGDVVNAVTNDDVSLTGAGGGGGYSQANVQITVLNDEGEPFTGNITNCNAMCAFGSFDHLADVVGDVCYDFTEASGNNINIQIPLFTDTTTITEITITDDNERLWILDFNVQITVTGDITRTGSELFITGDGSITGSFYLD